MLKGTTAADQQLQVITAHAKGRGDYPDIRRTVNVDPSSELIGQKKVFDSPD
jgi:hypothetical protein